MVPNNPLFSYAPHNAESWPALLALLLLGEAIALPLPHDSRHLPGRRSNASDLTSMLDLPGRRGEPGRHDLTVLVRRD